MELTHVLILPFVISFLISRTGGLLLQNRTFTGDWDQHIDTISFINLHTIPVATFNTYEQMREAVSCSSVPDGTVDYLLRKIELIYFYGSSLSEWIIAPLNDALTLVNDFRWDNKKPMVVYTHGWVYSPLLYYSTRVEEAYIANGKFNLVMVDWSHAGAFLEYSFATTLMRPLGEAIAEAVQMMLDAGVTLDHVVGHSLGAHISGHIGRHLRKRPKLVVGLDPAGPLFSHTMDKCGEELLSSDGDYVVALHTDAGQFGANEPTGPADFLAFGGFGIQPGCGIFDENLVGPACSHNRAIILWSEAISDSNSIIGQLCPSYSSFQENLCQDMPLSKLAEPNTNLQGLFFFSTNKFPPFSRGRLGISLKNQIPLNKKYEPRG